MTILSLKDLMEKQNLKNDTMKEIDIKRIHNYPTYPRDLKIISDEGFVNIHNGSQGRANWCCFIVKDNKSFEFDSLGLSPGKLLLN